MNVAGGRRVWRSVRCFTLTLPHQCRLRASLGLKPLKMEEAGPSKAQIEAEKAKEDKEKEAKAAELAERIAT